MHTLPEGFNIESYLFYYVVDETIKQLSQKQIKRKFTYFHCHYCWSAGNQECSYGLFCLIQWKTEQGNAPQVKYSAISPLLMITWWNINWVFSPVALFLIFHWFIGSSLSQKSGRFVTTLKSLFSPQMLALISATCTDSETWLGLATGIWKLRNLHWDMGTHLSSKKLLEFSNLLDTFQYRLRNHCSRICWKATRILWSQMLIKHT